MNTTITSNGHETPGGGGHGGRPLRRIMGTPLTAPEEKRLKEDEQIIEKNLDSFIAAGNALTEIRAERLYREDYPTFEEYCRRRWGFSKSHANRYIKAAEVALNLKDVTPEIIPNQEAHLRPLTVLSPAKQKKAWKKLIEEVQGDVNSLTRNLITRRVHEMFPEARVTVTMKPVNGKEAPQQKTKTFSRAAVLKLVDEWLGKNRAKLPNAAELAQSFKDYVRETP